MKHGVMHAFGFVILLGLGTSLAEAQTTANGPYYATPSWDQTLPVATRFVVLTNFSSQAVLDRETGLVWERTPSKSDIPAVPPGGVATDNYAAARCFERNIGGRYGWRLPTIQELNTLIDDSQFPYALPAGSPFVAFPGDSAFWTSNTTVIGGTIQVDFTTPGGLTSADPSSTARVWCVRGGSGDKLQ